MVIWEIASGKTLRYLRGHTAAVLSVEWHPDGARLASSGADKTVRIWNAHTAETLAVLNAPGEPVGNVHWHPDGKRILAAFAGGVKIWDTTSGKETDSFSIQLGRYVAISPDATRVAYSDRTHCVRDLKSQEIIRSRGPESRRPPVWRPDGKQLASTTDNGPIVIWDAQTGEVVSSILTKADQFSSPAWSPKGRFIAAFCPNRTTKVWDTSAFPPLFSLSVPTLYDTTVAFSPDGGRLLAAIGDGTLKVVAVESGRVVLSMQYDKERASAGQCAAWSPDGRRFAVRMRSDHVMIADAETGKPMLPLLPCGGTVRSLAWSPDGTAVAVAVVSQQNSGRVILFSAATGKEAATYGWRKLRAHFP